jgi:type IV pilus assembly protein PilW
MKNLRHRDMMHRAIGARRADVAHRSAHTGFTLLELLIALLIGLFLLGGLVSITAAMKSTGNIDGNLAQLHDAERTALTLITDSVQSAGYFPNPVAQTYATALPVTGVFTVAGQSIYGTGSISANPPGDTLTVRYATNGTTNGDGTLNCLGATSPTPVTWINTFQVAQDSGGNWNLQCVLTTNGVVAPAVTLVTGVTSMYVYYGVQTNAASGTNSVDAYLDANGVSSTTSGGPYWNSIISVRITLNMVNPLYGKLPGQTLNAQPTTPITRVVAVMNKTGVDT